MGNLFLPFPPCFVTVLLLLVALPGIQSMHNPLSENEEERMTQIINDELQNLIQAAETAVQDTQKLLSKLDDKTKKEAQNTMEELVTMISQMKSGIKEHKQVNHLENAEKMISLMDKLEKVHKSADKKNKRNEQVQHVMSDAEKDIQELDAQAEKKGKQVKTLVELKKEEKGTKTSEAIERELDQLEKETRALTDGLSLVHPAIGQFLVPMDIHYEQALSPWELSEARLQGIQEAKVIADVLHDIIEDAHLQMKKTADQMSEEELLEAEHIGKQLAQDVANVLDNTLSRSLTNLPDSTLEKQDTIEANQKLRRMFNDVLARFSLENPQEQRIHQPYEMKHHDYSDIVSHGLTQQAGQGSFLHDMMENQYTLEDELRERQIAENQKAAALMQEDLRTAFSGNLGEFDLEDDLHLSLTERMLRGSQQFSHERETDIQSLIHKEAEDFATAREMGRRLAEILSVKLDGILMEKDMMMDEGSVAQQASEKLKWLEPMLAKIQDPESRRQALEQYQEVQGRLLRLAQIPQETYESLARPRHNTFEHERKQYLQKLLHARNSGEMKSVENDLHDLIKEEIDNIYKDLAIQGQAVKILEETHRAKRELKELYQTHLNGNRKLEPLVGHLQSRLTEAVDPILNAASQGISNIVQELNEVVEHLVMLTGERHKELQEQQAKIEGILQKQGDTVNDKDALEGLKSILSKRQKTSQNIVQLISDIARSLKQLHEKDGSYPSSAIVNEKLIHVISEINNILRSMSRQFADQEMATFMKYLKSREHEANELSDEDTTSLNNRLTLFDNLFSLFKEHASEEEEDIKQLKEVSKNLKDVVTGIEKESSNKESTETENLYLAQQKLSEKAAFDLEDINRLSQLLGNSLVVLRSQFQNLATLDQLNKMNPVFSEAMRALTKIRQQVEKRAGVWQHWPAEEAAAVNQVKTDLESLHETMESELTGKGFNEIDEDQIMNLIERVAEKLRSTKKILEYLDDKKQKEMAKNARNKIENLREVVTVIRNAAMDAAKDRNGILDEAIVQSTEDSANRLLTLLDDREENIDTMSNAEILDMNDIRENILSRHVLDKLKNIQVNHGMNEWHELTSRLNLATNEMLALARMATTRSQLEATDKAEDYFAEILRRMLQLEDMTYGMKTILERNADVRGAGELKKKFERASNNIMKLKGLIMGKMHQLQERGLFNEHEATALEHTMTNLNQAHDFFTEELYRSLRDARYHERVDKIANKIADRIASAGKHLEMEEQWIAANAAIDRLIHDILYLTRVIQYQKQAMEQNLESKDAQSLSSYIQKISDSMKNLREAVNRKSVKLSRGDFLSSSEVTLLELARRSLEKISGIFDNEIRNGMSVKQRRKILKKNLADISRRIFRVHKGVKSDAQTSRFILQNALFRRDGTANLLRDIERSLQTIEDQVRTSRNSRGLKLKHLVQRSKADVELITEVEGENIGVQLTDEGKLKIIKSILNTILEDFQNVRRHNKDSLERQVLSKMSRVSELLTSVRMSTQDNANKLQGREDIEQDDMDSDIQDLISDVDEDYKLVLKSIKDRKEALDTRRQQMLQAISNRLRIASSEQARNLVKKYAAHKYLTSRLGIDSSDIKDDEKEIELGNEFVKSMKQLKQRGRNAEEYFAQLDAGSQDLVKKLIKSITKDKMRRLILRGLKSEKNMYEDKATNVEDDEILRSIMEERGSLREYLSPGLVGYAVGGTVVVILGITGVILLVISLRSSSSSSATPSRDIPYKKSSTSAKATSTTKPTAGGLSSWRQRGGEYKKLPKLEDETSSDPSQEKDVSTSSAENHEMNETGYFQTKRIPRITAGYDFLRRVRFETSDDSINGVDYQKLPNCDLD
ncbi:unnamed protein product [Cyprideis torosa]|uniref:Uncharacterized protein n=1 Tax=Cyprideis torosa TaxID=163714 RepID=A0A7R8WAZ0_9CRUS|nr:unnamed protein product [Cyprideis torosa]CAG0890226.1 unnamed protein product [Cyprideis torosa]